MEGINDEFLKEKSFLLITIEARKIIRYFMYEIGSMKNVGY